MPPFTCRVFLTFSLTNRDLPYILGVECGQKWAKFVRRALTSFPFWEGWVPPEKRRAEAKASYFALAGWSALGMSFFGTFCKRWLFRPCARPPRSRRLRGDGGWLGRDEESGSCPDARIGAGGGRACPEGKFA